MKEEDTVYKTKTGGDIWEKTSQFKIREPAIESELYRVYVSESTDGVFNNMIMVRNIGADSFGTFLSPGYEEQFGWIVYITAFGGEFPFFIWLLIKGVHIEKWKANTN